MAARTAPTKTGGRAATTGVILGDFALSVGKPDTQAPRGWKWTQLTAVARLETGHTPSRNHPEYWDGDIPWIGIKDATGNHGRTIDDTLQHTTPAGIDNSSARVLPANTVCLSRTASVGYVIVMGRPMATSQDFVNWVCSDALDHRYLKYVLLAERRSFLRFASGTTHQTIYFPEVKAFHVCLPPLAEQRAIAGVLGALDDKIEVNRKQARVLEGIARAVFTSWFVDFDPVRRAAAGEPTRLPADLAALFPKRLVDSPVGEVPKGWRVTELSEIVEVIDCLHTKKPERAKTGRLLLQLANIMDDGLLDPSDQYLIIEDDYARWSAKFETQAGDCVITNVGRVGAVAQIPDGVKAALGRNMTGLRPRSDFPYPTFLIHALLSESMRSEIVLKTDSGTILDALNVRSIGRLRVVAPPVALLQHFDKRFRPLRARVEHTLRQSATLATLRDVLLPKLISGELRIADAEKIVGRAV